MSSHRGYQVKSKVIKLRSIWTNFVLTRQPKISAVFSKAPFTFSKKKKGISHFENASDA